jgi:hypothetical protein
MKRLLRDLSIAILGGIVSIPAYTAIVDGVHSTPVLISDTWHQLEHFFVWSNNTQALGPQLALGGCFMGIFALMQIPLLWDLFGRRAGKKAIGRGSQNYQIGGTDYDFPDNYASGPRGSRRSEPPERGRWTY